MFDSYPGSAHKKTNAFIKVAIILAVMISACQTPSSSQNTTGPTITQITTSSQGFAIDCAPTSITVTANITDPQGIKNVSLWYRVSNDQTDNDQPYESTNMEVANGLYAATIKGIDLPAGPYGNLEFYVAAENKAGNKSQSPPDKSVQFLPCVGS
jgi:hypothetical protein